MWGKEGRGENPSPTRVPVLWVGGWANSGGLLQAFHNTFHKAQVVVWLWEATGPTLRMVDKGQP